MKKKSKFMEEFKKFILRGNVMDMAVGVIVGGAFTALVIFILLKVINGLTERLSALTGNEEEKPAPTTKKCPYCCSEIDIKATRCPHCTSVLEEE